MALMMLVIAPAYATSDDNIMCGVGFGLDSLNAKVIILDHLGVELQGSAVPGVLVGTIRGIYRLNPAWRVIFYSGMGVGKGRFTVVNDEGDKISGSTDSKNFFGGIELKFTKKIFLNIDYGKVFLNLSGVGDEKKTEEKILNFGLFFFF
ncbi:hypothetical protein CVV26_01360 [Candidatus Kuenenbacteria bacterium HGW-Kuenenbacteria-1]|uniref:Outer membrane protein beta-barrel domain-containing protein n=1 Tax=Candidatus Kuenenbacteria bacterium HGW-Kuenenbacteria-1 TaxID=2013812 RepID=A0A2N1UNN3_9BACT|nr:MAG: hypothetical protein CVV26_01360 [Candidatus Kuenenbacteria bacterium HGW-Kuenenbacteria-1]